MLFSPLSLLEPPSYFSNYECAETYKKGEGLTVLSK